VPLALQRVALLVVVLVVVLEWFGPAFSKYPLHDLVGRIRPSKAESHLGKVRKRLGAVRAVWVEHNAEVEPNLADRSDEGFVLKGL
jgi:hypothetical protein